MELGAIMELSGGRGKSTGKKGTPYIVCGKDPTVTHQPARGQWYYRAWPAVLPQGRAVLLLATKRYYHMAVRYYRTDPRYCRNPSTEPINRRTGAGGGTSARAVLPRPPCGTTAMQKSQPGEKGNFRAYFRKETEVAKTRHSSTAEGRYYCLTA